jgi:hypothetical protein
VALFVHGVLLNNPIPRSNSPSPYIFTDKPTLNRLLRYSKGLRAKKVSVWITDEPTLFTDLLGNVGGTVGFGSAATDKVHVGNFFLGGGHAGSPWGAGRLGPAPRDVAACVFGFGLTDSWRVRRPIQGARTNRQLSLRRGARIARLPRSSHIGTWPTGAENPPSCRKCAHAETSNGRNNRKEAMSSMKRVTPGKLGPFNPQLWMPHAGEGRELLTTGAIDDPEQPSKDAEHRIDVERIRNTSTGARYCVTYLGEKLIEGARTPLFDACRALLARGITGTLVMYSPGGSVPRMRVDIEEGSQLTVAEGDKASARLARYRPHPASAGGEDEE